ncbi:MAG TPA: FKBP-type peptidyl-prolyl cis-trans isomerase [Opitutaceae bacterium]|jgi:FKBP-type peptidyl-prolyl cis-trans isomerase
MKKTLPMKALILALAAASGAFAQDAATTPPALSAAAAPAPAYTDDQLLEEFGWYIANRTRVNELGLSPQEMTVLLKGFKSGLEGKESPYEIQKVGPAMSDFMQKKQAVILDALKKKNQTESKGYFDKLTQDKEVITLPSGLRYQVLDAGQGPHPKATDTVRVNYTGTLIDGNEFDGSDRVGHPLDIALNQVIPGWTEGLQLIGKGGKIMLFVPPSLGYGDDGRPGIPPGSVLVFKVELLDINPPAAAGAAAK